MKQIMSEKQRQKDSKEKIFVWIGPIINIRDLWLNKYFV
jgi:hypothetical protein